MPINRRVGGVWQAGTVKRRNGSFVNATSLKVRSGGTWVEKMASPLSLVAAPTSIYRVVLVASGTTGAVTVTASGGTGAAKTYAWTWVSNQGIVINSPSSNVTTFTRSAMLQGQEYNGIARCTVSDGTNSTYIDVPVTIYRDTDA